MNLQNTFYVLAIIYMIFGIIIMIALVILVFYIKNKITDISTMIEGKINSFTQTVPKSAELAVGLGTALAKGFMKKMNQKKENE